MEFRKIKEETTFLDIINFDSWQGEKILPVFYYLSLILIIFFSIVITFYISINNKLGVLIGFPVGLFVLCFTIALIRICCEAFLSCFIIKDIFTQANDYIKLNDSDSEGSLNKNDSSKKNSLSSKKKANSNSDLESQSNDENSNNNDLISRESQLDNANSQKASKNSESEIH